MFNKLIFKFQIHIQFCNKKKNVYPLDQGFALILCRTVVKNKNNFNIQRKDLGTLNSYPLLLKPLLFLDYPIY